MDLRIVAALSATAVAVPLAAGPAAADPVLNGEFAVGGVDSNSQISPGPDGNMWVTLAAPSTNDYARIAPDGTVTEYDAPGLTSPVGITGGPDGKMWVTYAGGVASFTTAAPTVVAKTAIADITSARAITTGPDGNLWTADTKVIRIPPANPAGFTAFGATGLVSARWIAAGTDGNLWVADFGGNQVVRVTPAGAGTTFAIGGGSQGIAGGPNGQVAFSQQGNAPTYVGRLTPPGPVEQTAAAGADPFGVAFGSDGAYWIAQFQNNNLLRLTPDGQTSTLALPNLSGPRHLSTGPGNTLWVTLDTTDKIARITGVTAPAPGPTPTPTPSPGTNPDTKITKAPKKVVRTKKARAKAKVRFTGTDGATFQCKVVRKPKKRASVTWRTCTSPKTLRLRKGKYTFLVRAVTATGRDASPAKAKFRVKRR